MGKLTTLLILLSLTTVKLFAQEDVKVDADQFLLTGFILAPHAYSTFDNDNPPFNVGTSLYYSVAYAKDKYSIAPYYSFNANSAGAFATYAFTDELGTYVVFDTSLETNAGGYYLGFTTPIEEDYIQGFIEIGNTYSDDPTPVFTVGLYFNLFKTLKEW